MASCPDSPLPRNSGGKRTPPRPSTLKLLPRRPVLDTGLGFSLGPTVGIKSAWKRVAGFAAIDAPARGAKDSQAPCQARGDEACGSSKAWAAVASHLDSRLLALITNERTYTPSVAPDLIRGPAFLLSTRPIGGQGSWPPGSSPGDEMGSCVVRARPGSSPPATTARSCRRRSGRPRCTWRRPG